MEAHRSKFFYWLIAGSILLLGYGQYNLPVHKEILQISGHTAPLTPSIHQNHSIKYTAEAASLEGIYVSGRNLNTEDKNKPYTKYCIPHASFDALAQMASVYIHRFSTQAYFSNFLYLLYCVLII